MKTDNAQYYKLEAILSKHIQENQLLRRPNPLRKGLIMALLGIRPSDETLAISDPRAFLTALCEEWPEDKALVTNCVATKATDTTRRPLDPSYSVLDLEATQTVWGTCSYTATSSSSFSLDIPERIVREAAEADDADILREWIQDEASAIAHDYSEEDDFSYENFEELDGDGWSFNMDLDETAEDMVYRYREDYMEEEQTDDDD